MNFSLTLLSWLKKVQFFCMTLVLEALIYITLTALWSCFIVCFIAEKQNSFIDRIYCSFFPNCFWHMFMFWLLYRCY